MSPARVVHRRRGTAIVAALALVTLAAALLASAAVVSTAGAHAALGDRASLAGESAARSALARTLITWDPAADSLGIGQAMEHPLDSADADSALPVDGRIVVRRLDSLLYAITADVRVGSDVELARRRVRLFVRRSPRADSTMPYAPPAVVGRWGTADLY